MDIKKTKSFIIYITNSYKIQKNLYWLKLLNLIIIKLKLIIR